MGACFSLLKPAAQTAASGAAHYVQSELGLSGASGSTAASDALTPPKKAPIAFHHNALVSKMPDGDTVTATLESGESVRVRVFAIDCPETKQNFGKEAGDIGRHLIFNKRVTLAVQTTDRYGRTVAEIIMPDGRCFGREMLRKGAAWHYADYDKREELDALMVKAKEKKIGLWAASRPQKPWVRFVFLYRLRFGHMS